MISKSDPSLRTAQPVPKKREQEVRAGTETEAMKMYSLLACSSRLAQPIFLYSPELPAKSALPTVDWDLPQQSLIKRMPQQTCQ